MRLVVTLVLTLFVSSVVLFLVTGRGALERAREEHGLLLGRLTALEHARATVTPVSYAETEALRAERSRLDELGNRRLDLVLDARHVPPVAPLEETLAATTLASLQPGESLREQVERWSHGALARVVLERLLADLTAAGIAELESLDLRETTTLVVDDLDALGLELVVVSEMEQVLTLLEGLTPGRGEPILSVTGASLRRIDPSLWSTTPDGLATPPVRLWVRLEAFVRRPTTSEGR